MNEFYNSLKKVSIFVYSLVFSNRFYYLAPKKTFHMKVSWQQLGLSCA